jgi:hypothetical protein
MKMLLLTLACFGFLSGAEAQVFFEASVNGTAWFQESFGRIGKEKITTERIFKHYNVSPSNYALVVESQMNWLYLLPRHVPVTEQNQIAIVQYSPELDQRGMFRLQPTPSAITEIPMLNTNAIGKNFDQFRGTAIIRKREVNLGGGMKSLQGHADVTGSSVTHIMKFRITTGKPFTYVPSP